MSAPHVLIAGGGIGGLSASLALRNAGLTTDVYERSPELGELGVAVILTPNGVKSLLALGGEVAATVIAQGGTTSVHAWRFYRPEGSFVTEESVDDLSTQYGAPQVSVRRSVLHAALLAEHGADGLHPGVRLESFADDGDGVTARFADGSEARGDLLVGADGLHSTVSRTLHGERPTRYSGWASLRGMATDIELPTGSTTGFAVSDGQDHVACSPMGGGDFYLHSGFLMAEGEWPRDPEAARALVLERIAGWYVVEDLVRDLEVVVPREVRDRAPLPAWSVGRVTLLGDAAHAMTNFRGQGANSALEDGVVLARCLADADDPRAGLARYDAARVPRTTRLVELSAERKRRRGHVDEHSKWTFAYDPATVEI